MTSNPRMRSFLTQQDLEARWHLSGRTLGRWRTNGYGPAWRTIGGSIRYLLSDVEAFEDGQRCGHGASVAPHRTEGEQQ